MIFPPLTSTQRESQTILDQLVSNYSHSSIPQNFTSFFKKYDTLQKVKYQVFHLQRYIQKNRDSCYDFLKNIMRNQLHKNSKSIFLNVVLILIWMVFQNYSPACTPLNEQGEQSILQDSSYNSSKQQSMSQNVSKPSIKQQINNQFQEEKVQNCCSPLNGEGEQSIQLNSYDNQASQNSKVQIDAEPLIKPSASDQKLQNCHIPLNEEGEQSFKEHSHDVQISNELFQIHHGVSKRSSTNSSNCQQTKQIDWTHQISEFIKAKRNLIKNVILKCQQTAENTSYQSFLLKHISRVKSAEEHHQAQEQIIKKYYSKISRNFEKYYSLVQSKQGYEFEPQQFYLFIRNFHEISSFLDKGSNENILDQLFIQSEQNFKPQLFEEFNPFLLMNIGFYHYLRQQFHKAHYYARWAYKRSPKIPNIAFLYGTALQSMGQLQEAHKVLKQNLKYEKIYSAVKLSLVMAKHGKSSQINNCLSNAKQLQHQKLKKQQQQQMSNVCKETRKILVDVKYFYIQVLHVEAYSLIHKQDFEAAINLMREDKNKDAKKSIYLAWCYFKLQKYKDCEEQILSIEDDSISYVNPLDYISYFEQFLNFERLSWSSRQRLVVLKQKAVVKLKQISKESLCFTRQLLKRKQYSYAYKLLKYIHQNFKSIGKLQLEKQLQIYMWKARVVQFNSSNTKNYSSDEFLRLQRQLKQKGMYEQKAFKLGEAFLNHDRRIAVQIFKKALQMNMNLPNLKQLLLNLKYSPQDSQNIEQWLETNLQNNRSFSDEIHLQMGQKYKFEKKYAEALKHYEKYREKYKFQQQKLLDDILECQFNFAISQSQQAFIYKAKIQRQLHNKVIEMRKSKDKVQPKFIKQLRQMALIKNKQYKDISKVAQQERYRLQMILNLLLRTITYDQIQFCSQKLQFVMATPQPELLVAITFSKHQLKVKFLKLIRQFAELHNLPSHQMIKSTIEMLQRYRIPSEHLLIYYNQVGMYQKVVQSYRKRLNYNDRHLVALRSQLISVSMMEQNALILLLHTISMQKTVKKKQKILSIISKNFFNNNQKSEEFSRFKTSLGAILQNLSEYEKSFLAQFTTEIFV